MSDFSTNLKMPYLIPAQAQKHVTVNEALRRLDVLVQMRVQSLTTAEQPAAPGDGEAWILPAEKTGANWDGFSAGRIAYYCDGGWQEITPRDGWTAYVADAGAIHLYAAGAWTPTLNAPGQDAAFASVAFPAVPSGSADPNTLDHYAEGVWTPALSFGGEAAGMAMSSSSGSYTRIGRQVFVRGFFQLSAKGSSSGMARISGLPFPSAAGGNAYSSGVVGQANLAGVTGAPQMLVEPDSDTIVLGQSGSLSVLNDTHFVDGSWVFFSVSYDAAT